MANLLSHSSVEERLDINFMASPSLDLRDRPAKFWRVVAGGDSVKTLASLSSESLDAYLFQESSLFVYSNRLVIVSCQSGGCLDGGLSLIWRYPEAKIETVVYQRRGEAKDFRKNLVRLRNEAGDRLGPAVVTGETVLFYPGQVPGQVTTLKNRSLLAGGRSCVQLVMRKLSPKIEAAFRKTELAQRRAATRMLGLDGLLKGFTVDEHHFAGGGFALTGIKGDEYFTLHASAHGARFEFGGRLRADVSQAITRLLSAFAPREHAVEALYGDKDLTKFALPCQPGTRWEPQPLGQHDARFILCSAIQASA